MKKLPYFEDVDWNSPEDYYEAELKYQNHDMTIDLNLDDDPEGTWAEDYTRFIQKLDEYYNNIRKVIKGYIPDKGGMVDEFFTFHFEEIPDEMQEVYNKTDANLPEDERKLQMLKLNRIGFYFAENNFATWDFSFGDFTDEILVIITDKKGEIIDITWES